jgi:hypothetical protein
MALAGAGWPEQMDHFGTVDELQFGKRQDAMAIERGLEREVEAGKRFDGRQARHSKRGADAAIVARSVNCSISSNERPGGCDSDV